MAGGDQALQIGVALGIGIVEMPGGHVQRRRCPHRASARRNNPDPRAGGRTNRRTPTGGWSGRAAPGPDRRAPAAGTESARSRARRAKLPPTARRPTPRRKPAMQGRAGPALFGEDLGFGGDFVARQFQALLPDDGRAWARCTSSRLATLTLSLVARKPNDSAVDDSPSRMRYAPLSTRAGHSGEPAEPARSTKMRADAAGCGMNPTD